jgi:hypothetical protein
VRPDSGGFSRTETLLKADKGSLSWSAAATGNSQQDQGLWGQNKKFFPAISFGSRWPHRQLVLTRWQSEARAKASRTEVPTTVPRPV